MVKQAARKQHGGAVRRNRSGVVKEPKLKPEQDFSGAAKRALAIRRFMLFLLTAVLLAVGIVSVCGVRLF